MINVGEIHYITLKYYNKKIGRNSFKYRPALIIHKADSGDYNILPVSTIKNSNDINSDYDIPIMLKQKSYIRVHKQTTANIADIDQNIEVDVKADYPNVYKQVIDKLKQYNDLIENNL